jgi:hypothetical protein
MIDLADVHAILLGCKVISSIIHKQHLIMVQHESTTYLSRAGYFLDDTM